MLSQMRALRCCWYSKTAFIRARQETWTNAWGQTPSKLRANWVGIDSKSRRQPRRVPGTDPAASKADASKRIDKCPGTDPEQTELGLLANLAGSHAGCLARRVPGTDPAASKADASKRIDKCMGTDPEQTGLGLIANLAGSHAGCLAPIRQPRRQMLANNPHGAKPAGYIAAGLAPKNPTLIPFC
jgi:hypothetical protein